MTHPQLYYFPLCCKPLFTPLSNTGTVCCDGQIANPSSFHLLNLSPSCVENQPLPLKKRWHHCFSRLCSLINQTATRCSVLAFFLIHHKAPTFKSLTGFPKQDNWLTGCSFDPSRTWLASASQGIPNWTQNCSYVTDQLFDRSESQVGHFLVWRA